MYSSAESEHFLVHLQTVDRFQNIPFSVVAESKSGIWQTRSLCLDTNPRVRWLKTAGSYQPVGEAYPPSASSIGKAKASFHSSVEDEVASPFASSIDQSWRVMGGE